MKKNLLLKIVMVLVTALVIILMTGCDSTSGKGPNETGVSIPIDNTQTEPSPTTEPTPPKTPTPSSSSGKTFTFEDVKIYEKWPLPASVMLNKELEYSELWQYFFGSFLTKEEFSNLKDIPLYQTPKNGKYETNKFYIHPEFDKLYAKGIIRQEIGIFFVKEYSEDELLEMLDSDGNKMSQDKHLIGYYFTCPTISVTANNPYIRIMAHDSVWWWEKNKTLVNPPKILWNFDRTAYLP